MTSDHQEDLDALFDRVPSLAGSPRRVQRLYGGLTNRNYKVITPGGAFVARVFADGGELLSINRDNEYRNTAAAAAAGAGAPVIEYRPEAGVLVTGYIEGRTLTDADVAEPVNIPRIAQACRRLHEAAPFGNFFNIFKIQLSYLDVVRASGFHMPAGYTDLMPRFEQARGALEAHPAVLVPCNNDLLAGNFIDDGDRIWLIDYEYSGNNDPCFELGNIWSECGLSLDGLAELVSAYFGRAYHGQRLRSKIARAHLLGLAAKYTWTLWGSIQASTSRLDADFWSWAMERYEGAAEGLTGPGFPRLLDEVQRDD
ncbi:MAG TPA: choline/ethanolamine kinase family protein [Streptosporangiaceae bacterium]